MGLDVVDIILRTEELFIITVDDDEAATLRTVGNFYDLICGKLELSLLQAPLASDKTP